MAIEMRITLRLPLAVHKALSIDAKAANVSLNNLIVERLNASTGHPYRGGAEATLADRMDLVESEIAEIRAMLKS